MPLAVYLSAKLSATALIIPIEIAEHWEVFDGTHVNVFGQACFGLIVSVIDVCGEIAHLPWIADCHIAIVVDRCFTHVIATYDADACFVILMRWENVILGFVGIFSGADNVAATVLLAFLINLCMRFVLYWILVLS